MNKGIFIICGLFLAISLIVKLSENEVTKLNKNIATEEVTSISQLNKSIKKKVKSTIKQTLKMNQELKHDFADYSKLDSEELNVMLIELEDEIVNSQLIEVANSGEMNKKEEMRLRSLLQKQNAINLVLIERELKEI